MVARSWSISALAVELATDRRTIAAALAAVPPAGKSRGKPTYRLADVVAAMYGPAAGAVAAPAGGRRARLDLTTESARLKKAQADKTELEVAVLRGSLIPGETVARVWSDFVTAVRAKFISLPTTAAPRVVGLTVREAETELRELVHGGLAELREYEPGHYSDGHGRGANDESGPFDRTAAGVDGKPVGRREPGTKPRGRKRTGAVVD